MGKIKDWFVAHIPTKRRLIQVYAALLYNANLTGFITGKFYRGNTKKVCVPGMNCYSCPGAVGACPLGSLQDSLSKSGTSAPAYILGILLLFGLMFARMICGFLCPIGLLQELLYKVRTPKLKKSRFTRAFSYLKYVLLALTIALPVLFAGIPAFCQYICPAGTFGGGVFLIGNGNNNYFGALHFIFSWKFCVMVVMAIASIFIYRFFCRFICPLGAIYSIFNRISLLGVKLDKDKCIDCGLCIQSCKMDIRRVGDHECIQCGECIPVCPVNAISWKGSEIFVKLDNWAAKPALIQVAQQNAEQVIEAPPEAQAEVAAAEPEIEAVQPEKSGAGQKIKAAFKRPSFVIQFVAWALAIALLIGAWIGYALTGDKNTTVYKEGDHCPTFEYQLYSNASTVTEFSSISCHGKVTVINYWYTDCSNCRTELPYFEEVYNEMSDQINMVIVHDYDYMKEYFPNGMVGVQSVIDAEVDNGTNKKPLKEYTIPFAQDIKESTYKMFGGDGNFPMTVVLDASGMVSTIETGTCNVQKIKAMIQKASK